jgi:hypothetical protein
VDAYIRQGSGVERWDERIENRRDAALGRERVRVRQGCASEGERHCVVSGVTGLQTGRVVGRMRLHGVVIV